MRSMLFSHPLTLLCKLKKKPTKVGVDGVQGRTEKIRVSFQLAFINLLLPVHLRYDFDLCLFSPFFLAFKICALPSSVSPTSFIQYGNGRGYVHKMKWVVGGLHLASIEDKAGVRAPRTWREGNPHLLQGRDRHLSTNVWFHHGTNISGQLAVCRDQLLAFREVAGWQISVNHWIFFYSESQ